MIVNILNIYIYKKNIYKYSFLIINSVIPNEKPNKIIYKYLNNIKKIKQ